MSKLEFKFQFLPQGKFKKVKDLLKLNGFIEKSTFDCEALVIKDGVKFFIAINRDEYNKLDEDMQRILLCHESSHAFCDEGTEEETDYVSMNLLNDKQIKILKSLWLERHGRTYEEFLEEYNS